MKITATPTLLKVFPFLIEPEHNYSYDFYFTHSLDVQRDPSLDSPTFIATIIHTKGIVDTARYLQELSNHEQYDTGFTSDDVVKSLRAVQPHPIERIEIYDFLESL